MKNFFEWFSSEPQYASKPWLVLGKGPTFAKIGNYDLRDFFLLGLNHVVREQPVDILHIIDVSVFDAVKDDIKNAKYVVVPWFPHIDYRLPLVKRTFHRAGDHPLPYWIEREPVLKELDASQRLLWYDASTSSTRAPQASAVVPVVAFSSTAAINLLALAGVRTIRSLGIDGGQNYSKAFSDLSSTTRLDSGQEAYDLQFAAMARSIIEHGLDLAPLDAQAPARIYVGCEPEQVLPAKVLEYSIRKHASLSVEVVPLFRAIQKLTGPAEGSANHGGAPGQTPFSLQRFAIPELGAHQGRAIYLDSDMLVFKDIRQLWLWPLNDAQILTVPKRVDERAVGPQFSVMVMNCEALDWRYSNIVDELRSGRSDYGAMVYEMKGASRIADVLPAGWNHLEHYERDETALLHYTDMLDQPWLVTHNKLGYLWTGVLLEAIADGFITVDEVREQVELGWVRPSVLYQVEKGIADPLLLPRQVIKRDMREFVPPFQVAESAKRLTGYGKRSLSAKERLFRVLYARIRYLAVASGAFDLTRTMFRNARKLRRWFS
jgi:hypothetical protein